MKLPRISLLIVIVAASGGCSHDPAPNRGDPPPVTLASIPGSIVHQVVLSPSAIVALDLRTEPVRTVSGRLVIPTTAVVYDPQGASWTYLATGPRTFIRQAIVIENVVGTDAVLATGPPASAEVVTAGAPELLGTEYGVGKE